MKTRHPDSDHDARSDPRPRGSDTPAKDEPDPKEEPARPPQPRQQPPAQPPAQPPVQPPAQPPTPPAATSPQRGESASARGLERPPIDPDKPTDPDKPDLRPERKPGDVLEKLDEITNDPPHPAQLPAAPSGPGGGEPPALTQAGKDWVRREIQLDATGTPEADRKVLNP